MILRWGIPGTLRRRERLKGYRRSTTVGPRRTSREHSRARACFWPLWWPAVLLAGALALACTISRFMGHGGLGGAVSAFGPAAAGGPNRYGSEGPGEQRATAFLDQVGDQLTFSQHEEDPFAGHVWACDGSEVPEPSAEEQRPDIQDYDDSDADADDGDWDCNLLHALEASARDMDDNTHLGGSNEVGIDNPADTNFGSAKFHCENTPRPLLTRDLTPNQLVVDVINVTGAVKYVNAILKSTAHIAFIQEHTMRPADECFFKAQAHACGWLYKGGPCDPSAGINAAGVGVLTRKPILNIQVTPITDAYRDLIGGGRALINAVSIRRDCTGLFANTYGHTGGHASTSAAAASNALYTIVALELAAQGSGPMAIIGDVNADLEDIPALYRLVTEEGWIDVGGRADIWGGIAAEFTCVAPGAARPTRRDFVIVNEALWLQLDHFQVVHQDAMPVHSLLQFRFKADNDVVPITLLNKPHSLHNEWTRLTDLTCPPLADAKVKADHKQLRLAQLHAALDSRFALYDPSLVKYLDNMELDLLWAAISANIEGGFQDHFQASDQRFKPFSGHGQVTCRSVVEDRNAFRLDLKQGALTTPHCSHISQRLLKRARQVGSIVDKLSVVLKGCVAPSQARHLVQLCKLAAVAYLKDGRGVSQDELDTASFLRHDLDLDAPDERHILHLRWLQGKLHRNYVVANRQAAADKREGDRAKFAMDASLRQHFKATRSHQAAPLTYVVRAQAGPNGELPGSFATQPREIDSIIINAWDTVYKGTARSHVEIVQRFKAKYDKGIYKRHEFEVHDITAEEVKMQCLCNNHSAAGLDGWTPDDWSLLSDDTYKWIARLLNLVEITGRWPQTVYHAKAVFLEKDPDAAPTPLAVRILLMLQVLYRKWASLALFRLKPWIRGWAVPEIYAGVPGRGASDASYATAVDMEYYRCAGHHVTGGVADIYKCFDQLVRNLVFELLRVAGMPLRILNPYADFLTGLIVYNGLVGCMGKPHKRTA
jgi:hypothetical protein